MARDASGHRPKRDNRPDFGANPSSIQRLLVNVPLPKMKLLPSGARLNRIDGLRLLPGRNSSPDVTDDRFGAGGDIDRERGPRVPDRNGCRTRTYRPRKTCSVALR